ncbi:filamentous hemagglutinin N-terminal domain-containing protein [Pannus brasiliensis CCIBt3594]|uniref:Filamentous hemagglutinin N-terminal domain-containing protein n=1 Tax=Pannus brasiliensis CCIBt3594 TaxID=1427578 RepID=A0AAW9QUB9_9CHRO
MTNSCLTLAQVRSDTTLGNESSRILLPGESDNNSPGDLIVGGARRGNNLFHSFQEFNIELDRKVYFANPEGVTRIFSRVTGNNPSTILGTLGVWDRITGQIGKADLFFINPNGIVFGQNARLAIGGSFLASTADSILFDGGSEFSAGNPGNPALLSVNIPIGLQYRATPGAIRAASSRLAVGAGRTLALAGGEVTIEPESVLLAGSLAGVGGRLELGGVGPNGRVSLQSIPRGWQLGYENVGSFADIELTRDAVINANGGSDAGSGAIQIQGKNVSFRDGAQAIAANFGTKAGGTITVRASDTLSMSGRANTSQQSAIANQALSSGGAGNIEISARNLKLADRAAISTQAEEVSSGQGGNISISATESIEMPGRGFITTISYGTGGSGNIQIRARDLRVLEGSEISASTGGGGRGGNVTIDATSIEVSGFSARDGKSSVILVGSETGATAPGGNLTIRTDRLRVSDGAVISAATASSERGGNISIATRTLSLIDGGQIISSTSAGGEAGNLSIDASDSILLSGRDLGLSDRVARFGSKNIPNLGANSGIFAGTGEKSSGLGGSIFLQSPRVTLQNSAEINVGSLGTGDAGDLQILSNVLTLDNRAGLTATSQSGEGGNITLTARDLLLLRDNSTISTTAGGTGNGGNITIDTGFLVAFPDANSDITANAFGGRGGAIEISALGIFGTAVRQELTPDNDITAFSLLQPTLDGAITLDTPELDPDQGAIEFPTTVVDPDTLIAQNSCKKGTRSELTLIGRGGVPTGPADDLDSPAIGGNLIEPVPTPANPRSPETPTIDRGSKETKTENPVLPARGWAYNNRGEVVLTAYSPDITENRRSPERSTSGCPVR